MGGQVKMHQSVVVTLHQSVVVALLLLLAVSPSKEEDKRAEETALKIHNLLRARHHAAPLKLNDVMSRDAANYAREIAQLGELKHSKGVVDGENLAFGCNWRAYNYTNAIRSWYEEVCLSGYDFENGHFSKETGHFTQIVWKHSQELGIGLHTEVSEKGDNCTYVVARYRPAGNYAAKFEENVKKGNFDSKLVCGNITGALDTRSGDLDDVIDSTFGNLSEQLENSKISDIARKIAKALALGAKAGAIAGAKAGALSGKTALKERANFNIGSSSVPSAQFHYEEQSADPSLNDKNADQTKAKPEPTSGVDVPKERKTSEQEAFEAAALAAAKAGAEAGAAAGKAAGIKALGKPKDDSAHLISPVKLKLLQNQTTLNTTTTSDKLNASGINFAQDTPDIGEKVSLTNNSQSLQNYSTLQNNTAENIGSAKYADPLPFELAALKAHNVFRKLHTVDALRLNKEMSKEAERYAIVLAGKDKLEHSTDRNGDGENLAFGCSAEGKEMSAEEAVKNWYYEVCKPGYRFDSDGSYATGRFTQVAWKGTTELGIGKARSMKEGSLCTYIVARYRQGGNVEGQYPDNVLKGSFDSITTCDRIDKVMSQISDQSVFDAILKKIGDGESLANSDLYNLNITGLANKSREEGVGGLVNPTLTSVEDKAALMAATGAAEEAAVKAAKSIGKKIGKTITEGKEVLPSPLDTMFSAKIEPPEKIPSAKVAMSNSGPIRKLFFRSALSRLRRNNRAKMNFHRNRRTLQNKARIRRTNSSFPLKNKDFMKTSRGSIQILLVKNERRTFRGSSQESKADDLTKRTYKHTENKRTIKHSDNEAEKKPVTGVRRTIEEAYEMDDPEKAGSIAGAKAGAKAGAIAAAQIIEKEVKEGVSSSDALLTVKENNEEVNNKQDEKKEDKITDVSNFENMLLSPNNASQSNSLLNPAPTLNNNNNNNLNNNNNNVGNNTMNQTSTDTNAKGDGGYVFNNNNAVNQSNNVALTDSNNENNTTTTNLSNNESSDESDVTNKSVESAAKIGALIGAKAGAEAAIRSLNENFTDAQADLSLPRRSSDNRARQRSLGQTWNIHVADESVDDHRNDASSLDGDLAWKSALEGAQIGAEKGAIAAAEEVIRASAITGEAKERQMKKAREIGQNVSANEAIVIAKQIVEEKGYQPTTSRKANITNASQKSDFETAPILFESKSTKDRPAFDTLMLEAHNKLREVHEVDELKLDDEMSHKAEEFALKLVKLGKDEMISSAPEERENCGENTAVLCSSSNVKDEDIANEIVGNWHWEVCNPGYAFDNDNPSRSVMHFTQLIWKSSTLLGIGRATTRVFDQVCTYVVARYMKAGNKAGFYTENVLKGNFDKKICAKKKSKILSQNGPVVTADDSIFIDETLDAHNRYRALHGSRPLNVDAQLTASAQKHSETLAKRGSLEHEYNLGEGENLAMKCMSPQEREPSGVFFTTLWYQEVCNPGYNFVKPPGNFDPETGHFTQVVWDESRDLGVGRAQTTKDGITCQYIVTRYHPAGNVEGEFDKNVNRGTFNQDVCRGMGEEGSKRGVAPRYLSKKVAGNSKQHGVWVL